MLAGRSSSPGPDEPGPRARGRRPRVSGVAARKAQYVVVRSFMLITGLACAIPAGPAETPRLEVTSSARAGAPRVEVPFAAQAETLHLADAPVAQLIEFLSVDSILGSRCRWAPSDIQDELARRRPITRLLLAYRRSHDPDQRRFLLDVLYRIDSPRVARFMRREATRDPSEIAFFANEYLARRGSDRSLGILAKNFHTYPVSSQQAAATACLFGTFRYRPAIPVLVSCLRAASLNLQEAALASLRRLFPDTPAEFPSSEDAIRYFETAGREPR